MSTGISKKLTLLVHRDAFQLGGTNYHRQLDVYQAGPFLEVYIDDLIIGKVRKLEPVCTPTDITGIAELCIKLTNYVILLTEEELIDIQLHGQAISAVKELGKEVKREHLPQ